MVDVVCLAQDMDKSSLVDIWSGKLGGSGLRGRGHASLEPLWLLLPAHVEATSARI